jgi:hypothetical protein
MYPPGQDRKRIELRRYADSQAAMQGRGFPIPRKQIGDAACEVIGHSRQRGAVINLRQVYD